LDKDTGLNEAARTKAKIFLISQLLFAGGMTFFSLRGNVQGLEQHPTLVLHPGPDGVPTVTEAKVWLAENVHTTEQEKLLGVNPEEIEVPKPLQTPEHEVPKTSTDAPENIEPAKPVVDETKPVVDETNTAVDEANPVVDETDPVVDEANSANDESKPATTSEQPRTEPEIKSADELSAEEFAKKAQNDEDVVAKTKTTDGHDLKIDKVGHIVECTECKVYEITHRDILNENPDLADELKAIRKKMAVNPEDPAVKAELDAFDTKMREAENFEKAKTDLLNNKQKIDDAYADYKTKKKAKGEKPRERDEWLHGKLNKATGKRKGGFENTLKGRVGEHQGDIHLQNDGFTKLNNGGKLVEIDAPPQGKGLDGVWEKNGELYVTETKYGTGKLTKEQMSDAWIRKELPYLKDKTLQDKIETAMQNGTLKKLLVAVDDRGIVTVSIINK